MPAAARKMYVDCGWHCSALYVYRLSKHTLLNLLGCSPLLAVEAVGVLDSEDTGPKEAERRSASTFILQAMLSV